MPRLLLTTAVISLVTVAAWGAETPAATTPKAKPYPLDTCIVSGEKLDSMGGAITAVQDGQEVKFCCKGCVKPFNKDPAKYLKKLAAPADKPAAGAPAPATHQH